MNDIDTIFHCLGRLPGYRLTVRLVPMQSGPVYKAQVTSEKDGVTTSHAAGFGVWPGDAMLELANYFRKGEVTL